MSIVKMSLFMAVAFAICALAGCASVKVTDPKDPRFDLQKFRFEDYKDDRDLSPVLMQFFPVGTQKQAIEHIFVNNAGASAVKLPYRENEYVYIHVRGSFLMKCAMKVWAAYDGQDILAEKLKANFGCK